MRNQYHITIQAIVSCDDENEHWVHKAVDNLDLSNLCSSPDYLKNPDPHTGYQFMPFKHQFAVKLSQSINIKKLGDNNG